MTGDVVEIAGSINNKGSISSVTDLKFPVEGYDLNGVTNLARIYLKKNFNMYASTPEKTGSYYVSPELDKILANLDKEYNIPKFEITEKMQISINELMQKYKMNSK